MDQAKLDHYRTILEQRAQELRASTANARERMMDVADKNDFPKDSADMGEVSIEKDITDEEAYQHRTMLGETENALARIQNGEFGTCTNCGKEIQEKRLEAAPWAAFCIDCQTELEKAPQDSYVAQDAEGLYRRRP